MRYPNGYGTIYKLSGNRRKPWIAQKTVGYDADKKRVYYTIGYYKSRTEAVKALVKYNDNPIGERGDITLVDLYKEWSASKYEKVGPKTEESYTIAWNHLKTLEKERFKDIRKSHLQKIIDGMTAKGLSKSSCHKVKVLAGLLYKYAMADDIVNKNYAELIEMPTEEKKEKKVFSDLEIKAIEKLAEINEWASTIMIMIYTGMRIGELLILTKFNVDLKEMFITGGIKTDAGKDRIIPIHPKIQKYVRHWYAKEGEFFISKDGQPVKVKHYRDYLYYPTLAAAGTRKLTPHSTRHTFATLANRAKMDTVLLQKIIGHADYSTTANIYTHPEIQLLKAEMEKIV